MSRQQAQAQLPPRCPFQKRATASHQAPPSYIDSHPPRQRGHQKSISESFALGADDGDHPTWLKDLLSDSGGTGPHQMLLHRSAATDSLQDVDKLLDTESLDSCGDGSEPNCSYGPNSPRRKDCNLGFPEKEIIASAFSEYPVQSTMHEVSGGNICGLAGENNAAKRHPGQRSRARKLQYIAELERSVEAVQNLVTEFSVGVASLLQQHNALSMENSTLKQRLHRAQQQKYIADGENRWLTKEVERLRLHNSSKDKGHKRSSSNGYVVDHSDAIWNMLNMRKLDI